jgi:hypothetical protein
LTTIALSFYQALSFIMRFSTIFTTAMAVTMPAFAIAKPQVDYRSEIAPRQDLSSALTEIVALIKELQTFLQPSFLDDINTVVTGLADLLADPFPNTTRTVLFTASDALGKIDLDSLLGQISPLLSQLTPILTAVSKIDIAGLINSASSLLTPDTIKTIGVLLNNANTLLTSAFITETQELIADAQPVCFLDCTPFRLYLEFLLTILP